MTETVHTSVYPTVESGSRMRADDRREQLVQVAIHLFAQKGFRGTTTKEIALAAGVTEALIFKYFPNKDALYEAILLAKADEGQFDENFKVLNDIADRRDDEALFRTVMEQMFAFHSRNVEFLRLMLYAVLEGHELAANFRERHVFRVFEFLKDYVALRQREGAFAEDLDPAFAVRALFGMPFHFSLAKNLFNCQEMGGDYNEAVDAFVRIALGGMRRQSSQRGAEV